MPIWLELIVVLLAAYFLGLAIGWSLWGRTPAAPLDVAEGDSE